MRVESINFLGPIEYHPSQPIKRPSRLLKCPLRGYICYVDLISGLGE